MPAYNPDDPLQPCPGESKRAVAAFNDYALMGAARSYRVLLAGYRNQEQRAPTKSWATLTIWAARFEWVERAARFDELQRQKAQTEYEAHWKAKVMAGVEVLGRLAEQGRVSIADFVEKRTELILDKNGDQTGLFMETVGLNWEAIRAKGHLVKSITSTQYGPRIELYDGQSALVQVARANGLFTEHVEQHSTQTAVHVYLPQKNDRDS